MNINISIDCTPEEARRFMGLPDLAPVHDVYLARIKEMLGEGATPELLDKVVRNWTPMGEMGFSAWKQMLEQVAAIGTTPRP